MTHCEKCIHYELCKSRMDVAPDDTFSFFPYNEDCPRFKNKTDYAEVKHGEWKKKPKFIITDDPDDDGYWREVYICSECEREEWRKEPYCHCGAKMDGGS